MATIVVDDPDAYENGNPVPPQGKAEVVSDSAPPPSPAPETPPADDIPEKFRGKQLNDILKSYEDMEKLVGRQGAELGELRRTHDEVIRSFITKGNPTGASNTPQDSTDDDTEFFVNPKKAIEKAVEKHPLVQQLRQSQTETVKEKALNQLASKHADWADVVRSPEFGQFVTSNPIHVQLMKQADVNFDVAAADYVLSQFKAQRTQAAPSPTPDAAAEATEAARRAAVSASKVPAGAAAPAAEPRGKIYSRADLIRKMQTDPEWYAAHADDILLAYAEKRVR